jgi:trk system potassium uptake protein TrkA
MMRKFAVIGLGKFGYKLATTLMEKGAEVIAIDLDKKLVDQIKDDVSIAVCLDSKDPEALKSQGLEKVDTAIVCIGDDFEANQLTTMHLKQMGVPTVITKTSSLTQGKIMRMIGADQFIIPEEEMGRTMAERLAIPNIESHIKLSEDHSLVEMQVPAKLVGKSIVRLELRKKYNIIVVYIRKPMKNNADQDGLENELWKGVIPLPDYVFEEDDLIFVLGREKDVRNFVAEE